MRTWKKMFVGVGLAMGLVFLARAVVWQTYTITMPGPLWTVGTLNTAGTNSSPLGSPFTVVPNTTFMLTLAYSAAGVQGTASNNLISGFDGTPDGTNWTTTCPLTYTNPIYPSSNCVSPVIFTAAQLAPYKQIRYGAVTTSWTNVVTISSTNPVIGWWQ